MRMMTGQDGAATGQTKCRDVRVALLLRIATWLRTQVEAAFAGWVSEAEAEAMRRELRRRMSTMNDARKREP